MGDDNNGGSRLAPPPRVPAEHCVEIVHPVVPPPHRSVMRKLGNRLKETFFPDDPLRQFKGQSPAKKWVIGAQYIFPILQWGPHYNFSLFKSDVVSGLTIASLAIPQVFFFFLFFLLPLSNIYFGSEFKPRRFDLY